VIPTRRVKYLLRALKRSIKNPPKINEHHPTDVFKSGAKKRSQLHRLPWEKLATSTNQQSRDEKLKGPAWAAAQGGASLTWRCPGPVEVEGKRGAEGRRTEI
jgi:hypothetical protein